MYTVRNVTLFKRGVTSLEKWDSQRVLIVLMSVIVSIAIALIAILYFVPKLWCGGWLDTLVLLAGVFSVIIIRNDMLIKSSEIYGWVVKFNHYHYEDYDENVFYATTSIERKIFAFYYWMVWGLLLGVPLGLLYLGLLYAENAILNWMYDVLMNIDLFIHDISIQVLNLLEFFTTTQGLIFITFVFIIGSLTLGAGYYICSGTMHSKKEVK